MGAAAAIVAASVERSGGSCGKLEPHVAVSGSGKAKGVAADGFEGNGADLGAARAGQRVKSKVEE